mgnify:CR=1 FL=1
MQIRLASDLTYDSIVDGTGLRMVVWTQGCPHHCPGCHNPQTHDYNGGALVDIDQIADEIIKYPLKNGVTLSGGEPFAQPKEILYLVKRLKDHNINIWSFSGYTFEQLLNDPERREILNYLDVLVDGRFVEELKSISLRFRGSSNQRIIDVPASLKENKVVLKEVY